MTQLVHNVSPDVDGGQALLASGECFPEVRWQDRQRRAMDRQISDMQVTGFTHLRNHSKIART